MGRVRTRGPLTIGPTQLKVSDWYLDLTYPYGDGPWTYLFSNYYSIPTAYTTYEEQCQDELHPGPPYRTGGPFNKWTYWSDQYVLKAPCQVINGMEMYTVHGHLPYCMPSAYLSYGTLEDFIESDVGDPSDYGAQAWNKFRPTRSGAELGVFLGELKDVPRMLKTTAKGFHEMWRSLGGSRTHFGPKNVADHWLNTQFGWLPFISDLRSFYRTTVNVDKKLNQLRRDNGRWIRRSGTVSQEGTSDSVETNIGSPMYPTLPTGFYTGYPYGQHILTTQLSKNVWFDGAFRYWIPGKPDGLEWDARALASIYGLYPSPSLVWELTPWSWLLDWCVDVGDVIANVSSMMFDNLCAKYAFCMCHYRQSASVEAFSHYKAGTVGAIWTSYIERKSRAGASPFGFGLTPDNFSARQWSILGALGISRLKI